MRPGIMIYASEKGLVAFIIRPSPKRRTSPRLFYQRHVNAAMLDIIDDKQWGIHTARSRDTCGRASGRLSIGAARDSIRCRCEGQTISTTVDEGDASFLPVLVTGPGANANTLSPLSEAVGGGWVVGGSSLCGHSEYPDTQRPELIL